MSHNESDDNLNYSQNPVLFALTNNTNYLLPIINNDLESRIINNVLIDSFNDKNPIKNVISKKGEEEIKFEKFNKDIHNCCNCPIFLTEFTPNDEIAILPCSHIFHKDAILKWLKEENNHCPTCRYALDSEEKREELQMSPQQNYSNQPNWQVFDFILNRLEDHIEQRQIESIILSSLNNEYQYTENNDTSNNNPESNDTTNNNSESNDTITSNNMETNNNSDNETDTFFSY